MPAKEYFKYKKQLIPEIKKAFQHLSEQYDIIVIEGAGSPAEINLKSDDIVNMGMARMAGAPVLLAGDIDRGGVFASRMARWPAGRRAAANPGSDRQQIPGGCGDPPSRPFHAGKI